MAQSEFQRANELSGGYIAGAGEYTEESYAALGAKVDEIFAQSPDHVDTSEKQPTEGRLAFVMRKASELVTATGLYLRGIEPRDVLRGGLAGGMGLISITALAACAEAPATQETDKPDENLSPQEKIDAAIAARPAEGTPEYEKLFSEFAVPYVEGQDPKEVLTAFDAAIDKWLASGAADGPQNEDELVAWFNEGKSLNDLADALQLDYYDAGAGDEIIGEGWEDTAWGQQIVLTEGDDPGIATLHSNRVLGIANGDIPKNATIKTTDVSISFNSPTEIRGTTAATIGGVDGFGGSYDVKAVDTDGDGDLDQWNFVGRAA